MTEPTSPPVPENTPALFDLGAYLAAPDDKGARGRTDEFVSYKPDDLTTHGVIVGMTGSGKTGLGVVLIEEAMAAGIPTLVLDPKGDMGNLLLGFPNLVPDDFAPWTPQGTDPAETAAQWKDGLAGWGLDGDSIRTLHDGNRFVVFTPGSTSGVPINILGSLAPPTNPDPEARQDEIEALVSGLLGLVGIAADPLSSPEHILMSNIVGAAWAANEPLDLATLLARIQDPPMRKLGVIDVDTFIPKADRTALMMKLNGLSASPGFAAWGQGVPLDVEKLLWDESGRPSCSVIYLAHLSDDERQMVVSLVLSKLITWMRGQQGSTKLRALVYMDEVYGFVPPTAAPPAKKPILTLYKQARAFGIGVVLATQNPVDLDYKAISNAGTWLIGRLQTERDKARLMDGLSAASGAVDLSELDATITGLGKRQFMLHTTGGSAPRVFGVRWAMSYLCGPLSKDQLRMLPGQAQLMSALSTAAAAVAPTPAEAASGASATSATPVDAAPRPAAAAVAAAEPSGLAADETPNAPQVAEGIEVRYLDTRAPWANTIGAVAGGRRLEPALALRINLLFDEEKHDFRYAQEYETVLFPLGDPIDVARAYTVDFDDRDLVEEQPAGTVFVIPPVKLSTKTLFSAAQSALLDSLYRQHTLTVAVNKDLGLMGRPGETAEAFAERCLSAGREQADAEADKIREKLAAKVQKIRDAIATAERQRNEAQSAASASKTDELLGGAGSVLGALLGGRRSASSIASAVRGVANRRSRSSKAASKVGTLDQRINDHQDALEDIESDLAEAIVEITDRWDGIARNIVGQPIALEKNDISITRCVLMWVPTA